jgi:hypothetical protein
MINDFLGGPSVDAGGFSAGSFFWLGSVFFAVELPNV